MLSTIELEKYIKKTIFERLGKVDMDGIHFKEGNEKSAEGTYIFCQNDKYHVLYSEKGQVRQDKFISEKEEVLLYVLDRISFNVAMKYAMQNKEEGKDFRRALFEKQLEIYSLFGEKIEKNKRLEIEEILKRNPYNDN